MGGGSAGLRGGRPQPGLARGGAIEWWRNTAAPRCYARRYAVALLRGGCYALPPRNASRGGVLRVKACYGGRNAA